jgi:hypothetical protein
VPQADGTKVETWNKQCGYAAATAPAATTSNPAASEPMEAMSANKRSEADADLDGPPSPDRAAGSDPSEARFTEWQKGNKFCKTGIEDQQASIDADP